MNDARELAAAQEDQAATAKPAVPPPKEGAPLEREPRDVRGQILGGQRYITREATYEASLFATWERIKGKFSRYGFAHVGGETLFNDTDGIYGGKAFLEMEAELVTFLHELAGNVPDKKFDWSLDALSLFLDQVADADYLRRIPLLFAKAASLFFNSDIGLKRPKEGSIFNLDVAKIFEGWYALHGFPVKVEEVER